VSSARLARPEDADDVIRLASIMYSAMGLDVSAREWQENAERMIRERSGGVDCAVFVVDDDETVVACGAVTVETRLPGPGVPTARYGYIQWMVTDPEHRRRGHGKAVFEAILAWLRERGVTAVELHATREGEALYRKYGFDDPMYPQLRARLQP
jgi:GNAT superfamily N-acetyltransferase